MRGVDLGADEPGLGHQVRGARKQGDHRLDLGHGHGAGCVEDETAEEGGVLVVSTLGLVFDVDVDGWWRQRRQLEGLKKEVADKNKQLMDKDKELDEIKHALVAAEDARKAADEKVEQLKKLAENAKRVTRAAEEARKAEGQLVTTAKGAIKAAEAAEDWLQEQRREWQNIMSNQLNND